MRVKMAIDLRVRQRNLELSGTTSWLTQDLLAFHLRGKALRRGPAQVRLELFGTGRVIETTVRILTIELGGLRRRNNYTARLVEISPEDQASLRAWLAENSGSASQSLSSSTAQTGGRSGRGLDKLQESPDLAPGDTSPTPASSDPTQDLVLAPRVKLASDGSSMSVSWSNAKSVKASWEESLRVGRLRVYLEGRHPPPGYSLIVQLHLPDGSVHATLGRIDRSEGPTLYLNMTLKTSVKQALSAG